MLYDGFLTLNIMKTAMEELIDYIEEWTPKNKTTDGIWSKAKNLLAKEKEQIINARIDGVSKSLAIPKSFAEKKSEEYYVITFSDNVG
jgi:ribosome-interacting GTPase 1